MGLRKRDRIPRLGQRDDRRRGVALCRRQRIVPRGIERERVDAVVEAVAVGIGEERIGAHRDFGRARQTVAILVGIGTRIRQADLDAIEGLLGTKRFLVGDRLSMADIATYGMLYPMARWPMRTPAADDIKSRPGLVAYLERVHEVRAERPAAAA